MLHETRIRRIRAKYRRALAARERVSKETKAFVAEVEAAKAEDGIPYSAVATELGISRQALNQARDRVNGKGS